MKKNMAIFAAFMAMFVWTAVQNDKAFATETHWTDGTTWQGSVNYQAPPAIQSDDPCNIWMLDPPTSYVWLTVHFVENNSEYDSKVFEYVGTPGGSFPANINQFVHNHQGGGYLTWNIGTGQSPLFQFNCVTQTTTSTVSSTTSSTITTTTTSLPTSSTSSSSTSTISDPTTTSSVLDTGINGQTPSSIEEVTLGDGELARTGTSTAPLIGAGIIAAAAGTGLILSAKQRKARQRGHDN